MTGIFRDAEENRKARGKARLKFLVDRVGPEALREELEHRVGRPLRRGVPKAPGPLRRGPHRRPPAGRRQPPHGRPRRPGRPPEGRASCSSSSRLARKYGANADDALRLTHQQNVLLPWIPRSNVDALLAEPLIADLTPTPTLFQRGLQTCTGKEFCGLAKVYTKSRAVEIAKFLDEHVRPNGHGEDFRAALRRLLVELRAAPDRRRRHRGRAQEGRRRVRRGDGHPHRRPPRRGPAVRRRRGQEGPALGAQRDAAADLQPLRAPTTTTARRSATSRAAPSPSGGRRSSTPVEEAARVMNVTRGAGAGRRAPPPAAGDALLLPEGGVGPRRRARAASRPTRASSRSTPACCSRRRSPPGGRSRSASASTSRSRTRPATGPARRTAAASARSRRSSARSAGADAWITGIRREQSPTRADAQPVEFDDKRGIWKYNPLVEWTEKDLWRRIHERDLPYHPLHDQGYASIGCAPCTDPGAGREGRWAGPGQDRVRAARLTTLQDRPVTAITPRSRTCARSRPRPST